MCRYCAEYGNGTKWYLNPDNYNPELFEGPGHSTSLYMLSGVDKNTFELGAVRDSEALLPDYNYPGEFNVALAMVVQHQGQIVPLEDALKILDLVQGDRFNLGHCSCRRYFGHEEALTCLFFPAAADRIQEERTWETDNRILTREEAKEFEIEMDKKGLVHSVWDCGVDSDGKPPICICHCLETDCMPTRFRAHYGITNAQRKGEYVARVNRERCAAGCQKFPLCVPRCPFGAMRRSPLDNLTSINISQCYGCGLCRAVCPTEAISLVDRTTFPGLVDVW